MKRIGFYSNCPHVQSGYGQQTRHVVEGMQKMGYEVALMQNFGVQGGAIEMGGMRVYPIYRDRVGMDVVPAHVKHFGADLFISLYDLWPFTQDFAASLHVPWASWFPQDSYPPCPTVVERAKQADYPIAMSKFGLESMKEQGVDCWYVPHGCSVDVYKPLDKVKCREELSLPADAFIVLMVAANQSFPSRKGFPEALSAFKAFHLEHPESLLYLHTTKKPRGAAWDGIELDLLIQSLGLEDCVRFVDEYALVLGLPDTEMAKAYNAADVLLCPSTGEGFGVPLIEAQSCGLPVITTNFSSMTELTFNGVTVAPVQLQWTALGTWQAVPSISGVIQALGYIHARTPEETQQAAAGGRQAIVRDYSWPVVMEHWRKFLAFVESGEKPSTERLYHIKVKGVEFDAYDDKMSFTISCVEGELATDRYGLDKITFEPGDVILDIGAHVGVFSIYAAKRWPEARILAYEPSPTSFDRLTRNLALAGVTNVEAFNLAVTDNGRDIEMSLPRGNTGGNSEFVKPNGHIKESAKSTTLDAILDGLTPPFVGAPDARIKLLKIDAEGGEHSILMGASCLDRIEHISGELHINKHLASEGYSIEGLKEYLRNYLPAENITVTDCRMAD